MANFPVAEAQIVALFMECIVYGIYLVTLWITARALFFDAAGDRKKANWPMVAVMALMSVFATLDVSLGLKHNLDAFIFSSGPSGPQPEQEFRNISYWVNVMKTVDTQVMTLIGDAMLIYRAFIVFSHSLLVVILPVILWLAATACSVAIIWITATLNQNTVISSTGLLKPFLYAFFCITIVLNLLTTAIIIQKIWRTNKKSAPYITHASQSRSSRPPRTKLENVIRIILESGMLYTITVLITFICELAGSNAIYGVSDVMVITVGISFNLIIIRVDRAASSSEVSATPSNAHGSIGGFPLRFLRSSMTHERSQRNVEITITRDVAFDGDMDSDDKTGRTDADADTDVEGKPETGWAVAV